MELLFDLLFSFAGEFLVQFLFELGFRALVEPFRGDRPTNVLLALLGYVLLGLLGGAISLLLVPQHLIDPVALRYANLAITPIMLGLAFEWMGKRREQKGKQKRLLDRFSYGFAFALTMGLIRLAFAK